MIGRFDAIKELIDIFSKGRALMRFYLKILAVLALSFATSPAFAATQETAIFAGGCFWCMQAAFEELPGVGKVTAGYTGGHVANPTYEQVSSGTTGHVESIQVTYDPQKLSYTKLLNWFWDNGDPSVADGRCCD